MLLCAKVFDVEEDGKLNGLYNSTDAGNYHSSLSLGGSTYLTDVAAVTSYVRSAHVTIEKDVGIYTEVLVPLVDLS
jgi:hypothetical protein